MIDGRNWLMTQKAMTAQFEYSIQFYQYIYYSDIHIAQVGDCWN